MRWRLTSSIKEGQKILSQIIKMAVRITFEDRKFVKSIKEGKFCTAPLFNLTTKENLEIEWEGILSSNGISKSKFGDKVSYSFGFKSEDDNCDYGAHLFECFQEEKALTGWVFADLVKYNSVYFKLQEKNGAFNATSNLKWSPENIHELPITKGQKIVVSAKVNAYFNPEKQICGIYFTVSDVQFNEEDSKTFLSYYK